MNAVRLIQFGEFIGTLILAGWLGWKCWRPAQMQSKSEWQEITVDTPIFIPLGQDGSILKGKLVSANEFKEGNSYGLPGGCYVMKDGPIFVPRNCSLIGGIEISHFEGNQLVAVQ